MDLADLLTVVSVAAIPLIFAITLHEVAHGWMARRCGDNTAAAAGRLSLNPLRHVDPVGTVLFPLLQLVVFRQVLFGWAKPVPVVQNRLNNPRGDMIKVAIAGPGANVLMAALWAVILAVAARAVTVEGSAADWIVQMAFYGVSVNVLLAAFNLLPVPPLDGGRVLANALPVGPATRLLDRMEPWGLPIVLVLLLTGVAWRFVEPLMRFLQGAIFSMVGLR